MSSFYGNSGGSGGQDSGLTPEQLALIYNAQWKSEEKTKLFDETVSIGLISPFYGGTLSYSEPITADVLYVTFNGEEYTCPRIDAFGGHCYGGITSTPDYTQPDFSEIPFFICSESNGTNSVLMPTNLNECTISASTNEIAYTDTFKEGVENFVDKWRVIQTNEIFNETINMNGYNAGPAGIIYGGQLSYSEPITADELEITFNGNKYICPRVKDSNNNYVYGDNENYAAFQKFPFTITNADGNVHNILTKQTNDTCTISAVTNNIFYTDGFITGVKKYSSSLENIIDAENGGIIEGMVNYNVASGVNSHAEGGNQEDDGDGNLENYYTTASGDASHAEGVKTTASGYAAHAEGSGTKAIGAISHSEGQLTEASGHHSHAEGMYTKATGECSHAEGRSSKATGESSHAEGNSQAIGSGSHAEGNSKATGERSHAEGSGTTASGYCSHSEGASTEANHYAQHVFGEFNVKDSSSAESNVRGNYVEIVGNGTSSSTRSNARTLDWSGNEALSGNLTLGKGTANETELTAAKLKEIIENGGGSDSSELFIIDLTFEPKHGYDYKTDPNYKGVWSGNTVYNEGDIVWIRRGTSNISDAEPWSAHSAYGEDALVSYRGEYYKCINYVEGEETEEIPSPDIDTTHWENTSETSVDYGDYCRFLGEEYMFSIPPIYHTDDEPPVNYIEQSSWYRGSWSNSTTYSIGDIVTFEEDIVVENEGTEDEVTCHYTYTAISKVDNNLNNVIPNSAYENSEYWRTIIVSQIRTDGTSGSESSGSTWELCSSYTVQEHYIGNKTYNEVFTAISDGKIVIAREHINDGKAEDDFDNEVYRYFYCDEAFSTYEPMVDSDYERLDVISFGKISNNGLGILRSDDPIVLYPESSEEKTTDPLVVNFNYNEGDIEDVTEKDEYAGVWDENTSYDTDQIVSIKTYESPSHYEYIGNWKGEWNLTVTYNENDLIRVTSDLTLLPDYKGTWDSSVTYNNGDIVSVEIDNETKFYRSYSSDNIGNDPSTDEQIEYWSLYYPEYSDYIGRSSDNIGNNPTTDDETNWINIFNVDYGIESDYAIKYKGAWDSSVVYNDGDTVSYVNNDSVTQYYQYYWADTDQRTSPDENSNWTLIGPNASTSYYKSLIDSNENNDPATDDGTNWEIYEPQLGDPYYESDCSYEDITEALNAGRYVYGRDSYLPGDVFDSHECHIYTLTECSITGYGGESVSKHMVFSTTSEFGKTTVLKSLGHYVGWDEKLKFEVVEAGSSGSSGVFVVPLTFVPGEVEDVTENEDYKGEWDSARTDYNDGCIVHYDEDVTQKSNYYGEYDSTRAYDHFEDPIVYFYGGETIWDDYAGEWDPDSYKPEGYYYVRIKDNYEPYIDEEYVPMSGYFYVDEEEVDDGDGNFHTEYSLGEKYIPKVGKDYYSTGVTKNEIREALKAGKSVIAVKYGNYDNYDESGFFSDSIYTLVNNSVVIEGETTSKSSLTRFVGINQYSDKIEFLEDSSGDGSEYLKLYKREYNSGDDEEGGLTPEQLALIENAQWKSEETTELFNETLEGWRGAGATLSYSDEITANPLYVTFNGEEYVCPRNEYFGMICYGGFGSKGPDFSEYPFYIIRNGDKNTVTPSYSSTQTFTISARGTTTTYTDAFKKGVEKYNCTYVKDYIDPQTNNKTGGVIEGDVARNVASGNFSHAEGTNTTASGTYSHAEGGGTAASGLSSHAEGADTTASGSGSHAEGSDTTASGYDSHAEGTNTTASGSDSHAEGFGTNAKSRSQHVFGEFNVADPSTSDESVRGTYVEIVGNGTKDNSRSNARTLDWSGNESLAGGLTLGKGTADEVTITAAQLKALLALLN